MNNIHALRHVGEVSVMNISICLYSSLLNEEVPNKNLLREVRTNAMIGRRPSPASDVGGWLVPLPGWMDLQSICPRTDGPPGSVCPRMDGLPPGWMDLPVSNVLDRNAVSHALDRCQ